MLRRLGTAILTFRSFELKAYGLTYMLQGGELSPHLEAMPTAKDPKISRGRNTGRPAASPPMQGQK
jgi:hypothetical protein